MRHPFKPRSAACALGLLFCTWPLLAAADGLGRLFTTPEERRLLDQARRGEAQASPGAVPTGPSSLSFNGYVLRSQGPPLVWINGAPVTSEEQARQLGVGLQPGAAGLPVLLQAGPPPGTAAAYELPEPLRRALQGGQLPGAAPPSGAPPAGIVWLRPGQTLDRGDGRITENYLRPAPSPAAAPAAASAPAQPPALTAAPPTPP